MPANSVRGIPNQRVHTLKALTVQRDALQMQRHQLQERITAFSVAMRHFNDSIENLQISSRHIQHIQMENRALVDALQSNPIHFIENQEVQEDGTHWEELEQACSHLAKQQRKMTRAFQTFSSPDCQPLKMAQKKARAKMELLEERMTAFSPESQRQKHSLNALRNQIRMLEDGFAYPLENQQASESLKQTISACNARLLKQTPKVDEEIVCLERAPSTQAFAERMPIEQPLPFQNNPHLQEKKALDRKEQKLVRQLRARNKAAAFSFFEIIVLLTTRFLHLILKGKQ
ncbi:MAG: hypothetical protein LW832_04230 [Parachlamydia sp.]|jgi:hypothetical protein|nr:hypothetical protein [Parachlamydia sp.]